MEEELLKRNTDCVYFLASPLTCKKGLDCEYRHNEIARLNPRDCWYWLSGTCFNPTCGFRHPPLDALMTEPPSESTLLACHSSMLVKKTSIPPCYFFFNGFCNKGDRCSFLHGSDDSEPAGKPSKAIGVLSSEDKVFDGKANVQPPAGIHPNASETISTQAVNVRVYPKDDMLQSAATIIPQQSDSSKISLSDGEAEAVVSSDSMVPAEGFIKTEVHLNTDWTSEEQLDDHVEPEERLGSSPGFDVLVDNENGEENLGYEDDPEYLLAIDREQRELSGHFLDYDFEDSIEHDAMYSKSGPYECETYNLPTYLDTEHIVNKVREEPSHSRGRVIDSILSRKRKLLPKKLAVDDCNADLRNYLTKRRAVDGCTVLHSTRRIESSQVIRGSQDTHRSHFIGQRLHGRFPSEFGKNYIESHGYKGTLRNAAHYRPGWPRHSKTNMLRQRQREKKMSKRKPREPAGARKTSSRERSGQILTAFTGPKSLAEIKQEKKQAEENGDHSGVMSNSSRTYREFRGPKPLSEILKEKRRLGTLSGGDTCSC